MAPFASFLLLLTSLLGFLTTPAQEPAEPASKPSAYDFSPGGPIPDAQLGRYHVELQCKIEDGMEGSMWIEFWAEHAPATVRNFLRYASEGFYDGLSFHRVIREFMVQGGDPSGNGTGTGPHGSFADEFSTDLRYGHGYGVISMAHSGRPMSAGCQFFICTADAMNVFRLDGKYAAFGKVARGVAMLEAIANVPATRNSSGEVSSPSKRITIVHAIVHEGPVQEREEVTRPQPDFGSEPAKVVVQHLLVSFAGTRTTAKRSKAEAEALAIELLARAQAGEDFEALVREYSDDQVKPGSKWPGIYRLLNGNAFDASSERALYVLQREMEERRKLIEDRYSKGEIDVAAMRKEVDALQQELGEKVDEHRWTKRAGMARGFGDAAFHLQEGEIGIVPYDPKTSPFGWHIMKRLPANQLQ